MRAKSVFERMILHIKFNDTKFFFVRGKIHYSMHEICVTGYIEHM